MTFSEVKNALPYKQPKPLDPDDNSDGVLELVVAAVKPAGFFRITRDVFAQVRVN
jgi:hypothetical protein